MSRLARTCLAPFKQYQHRLFGSFEETCDDACDNVCQALEDIYQRGYAEGERQAMHDRDHAPQKD